VWLGLKVAGILPRRIARGCGAAAAAFFFLAMPRIRKVADFNLQIAFPKTSDEERKQIVRGMVRQIGWMAGELTQFPRYARWPVEKMQEFVQLDGIENFLAGQRAGKGVLVLTGHMSAWELAPFAQARFGYPLHFLAREVENKRVDALVNSYRMLSGNIPIEKNQSARTVLKVLSEGGTVGVLADQNTILQEGIFVDFFGVPACTTTGIARLALHTGAAVVPGYILWDESLGKYRLNFDQPVELACTGDLESDIRENTARFTRVIEECIRRHPEQWVWIHKRWKTRPPGEQPLYPF